MSRAVIDQPGSKILLAGLVASIFLGLLLKSQIRETVVHQRLQVALKRLEPDLKIDFEKVEVKLSDWGLPRPAVKLYGLRISPVEALCSDYQLYVEQLSIPLTASLIFEEKKVISKLSASLVEVRLGKEQSCLNLSENKKNIDHEKSVSPTLMTENGQVSSVEKLNLAAKNQKTTHQEISIDRLRIIAPSHLKSSLDFNAFQLNLQTLGQNIENLTLQTQFLTFKDPLRKFYLFKSDLKAEYSNIKNTFGLDIKGLVVDRPVQFKLKSEGKKNNLQQNNKLTLLNWLLEIDDVSLKGLISILKIENSKFERLKFLNSATINGTITGTYNIAEQQAQGQILNAKVNLGQGFLEASEIGFTFKDQFELKPFDVQITQFDLSQFISLGELEHLKTSLAQLGTLSGQLQFMSANKVKLKGLVEKTGFYFSHAGERAVQFFDSFNIRATLDEKDFYLNLDDFTRGLEKIKGQITYKSFNQQTTEDLQLNLVGKILSLETLKIYSDILNEPTFEVEIKAQRFKDRFAHSFIQGQLKLDQLSLPAYTLIKPQITLSKNLNEITENFNLMSSQVTIHETEFNRAFSETNLLIQLLKPLRSEFSSTSKTTSENELQVKPLSTEDKGFLLFSDFKGQIQKIDNFHYDFNFKANGKSQLTNKTSSAKQTQDKLLTEFQFKGEFINNNFINTSFFGKNPASKLKYKVSGSLKNVSLLPN